MIRILNVYIEDKNHRVADWCHCCNCWSDLLIDVGTDKCPMCKSIGTLMSANDGTPVSNCPILKIDMMKSEP